MVAIKEVRKATGHEIIEPHITSSPAWVLHEMGMELNYARIIDENFPKVMFKHSALGIFAEWTMWEIMVFSPILARWLQILVFMFPVSFCFYYIWRHKFGFSQSSAFTAAVLPNIRPYQWQIPAGINMSYTLRGLTIAVLSLIIVLEI